MRNALTILIAITLAEVTAPPPKLVGHFSNDGDIGRHVSRAITAATRTVHMAAYEFTAVDIRDALIDRARQRRNVEIIMDADAYASRSNAPRAAAAAGVQVFTDAEHAIFHDKYIIIDGQTVITGSFNWTTAAENRNAENVVIIHDEQLAARYERDWQEHKAHAARRTP